MKLFSFRVWVLLVGLSLTINNSFSQVYFLNEDFSSATGSTPPTGWSNTRVTGQLSDNWRFNNPGNRTATFPIIGNFAIFDAQKYSETGGVEKSILESPFVDCSFSQNILLYFDHHFVAGTSATGTLEVFDGTQWTVQKSFSLSTNGVSSEVVNISSLVGGKTNAKFRFTWEGNGAGYWLIDNVKIFAPLTRDAGIRSLDAPLMPFSTGVNPIKVTLSNDGI
jgi:hypothetical protein